MSGRSITISKRCGYCGDSVEVYLNANSTESTVQPILRAFNKVHKARCKHPRGIFITEFTVRRS